MFNVERRGHGSVWGAKWMQAGPRPWPQAGCRLQQHGGRHGGRPDSGQPAGPRAPGRVAACAPPPHPGVQPPRTGSFSHKSQRMKIGVPPQNVFSVFFIFLFLGFPRSDSSGVPPTPLDASGRRPLDRSLGSPNTSPVSSSSGVPFRRYRSFEASHL